MSNVVGTYLQKFSERIIVMLGFSISKPFNHRYEIGGLCQECVLYPRFT